MEQKAKTSALGLCSMNDCSVQYIAVSCHSSPYFICQLWCVTSHRVCRQSAEWLWLLRYSKRQEVAAYSCQIKE